MQTHTRRSLEDYIRLLQAANEKYLAVLGLELPLPKEKKPKRTPKYGFWMGSIDPVTLECSIHGDTDVQVHRERKADGSEYTRLVCAPCRRDYERRRRQALGQLSWDQWRVRRKELSRARMECIHASEHEGECRMMTNPKHDPDAPRYCRTWQNHQQNERRRRERGSR